MFRPISIEAVANGFIVSVGCQRLVYPDPASLTADLHAYLTDPDATEAAVRLKCRNLKHTLNEPTPEGPLDTRTRQDATLRPR